jgi:hypothetical protein
MGVGGQHHAPAAFTPGKDPVPIVQEAGWTTMFKLILILCLFINWQQRVTV